METIEKSRFDWSFMFLDRFDRFGNIAAVPYMATCRLESPKKRKNGQKV
jgi:hypothetical protein